MIDASNLNDAYTDAAKSGPAATSHLDRQSSAWIRVLGWFWSLLCLFTALGLGAGRPFAAFLYVVCGAMTLPPLWQWLGRRGGKTSVKVRTVVGFLALIGANLTLVGTRAPATSLPKVGDVSPGTKPGAADAASQQSGDMARRSLADARHTEQRNSAKIGKLLFAEKSLGQRDYEGQQIVWNEIVALAPSNAEYARRKQQIDDKVSSLASLRDHPEQGMVVEKVVPRREGFGTVLIVDITLRNDSLSTLKDFRVSCIGSGRSGTAINSNTIVLYETVEARSTRTIRNVNMGLLNPQVARTRCAVEDASVA